MKCELNAVKIETVSKYELSNLNKILNRQKFPMCMLSISSRINVDNAANLIKCIIQ